MEVSGNFARFVFQNWQIHFSGPTWCHRRLQGAWWNPTLWKPREGRDEQWRQGRTWWQGPQQVNSHHCLLAQDFLILKLEKRAHRRLSPLILLLSQKPIQRRKKPTKEEEQERRPRRKEQEQVDILADMIHSNFFIHPGAQGGAAGARLTGVWAGEGTGASRGAHHPRRGAGDTSSV